MESDAVPLEAVSERDIDLLVLEELSVSDHFAKWFVSQAFKNGNEIEIELRRLVRARHSVTDASGESDLELVFEDRQGARVGLLIENKISARAQPDQALRYRARANSGVDAGSWGLGRTCIMAPEAYLQSSEDAKRYEAQIRYEDIAEEFRRRASSDRRAKYRAEVLGAAIEQARRGYVLVADKEVTAFWNAYWLDANRLFPETCMPKPSEHGRGSQATWIGFRPRSLAPGRTLFHKLTMGVVDLTTEYGASRVEELAASWKPLLAPDTSVVATGKSLSVRVDVEPLDIRSDYAAQNVSAHAGMRAAYRLLYLSAALRCAPPER